MRTTNRTRIAAVLLAGVTGLALTACSSGSGRRHRGLRLVRVDGGAHGDGDAHGRRDDRRPRRGPGRPRLCRLRRRRADGAGSVDGMALDPVATAASNNPLLTTLVAAVSGQLNPDVNLVDTLNGDEFTVFAPVDDAFAKIDAATIDTLKTDAATLTGILTYHVVPGQLSPAMIVGTQTTVQGGTVEVTGSGDTLKVNGANVICGGVQTANATVYLIDSVLMPTM